MTTRSPSRKFFFFFIYTLEQKTCCPNAFSVNLIYSIVCLLISSWLRVYFFIFQWTSELALYNSIQICDFQKLYAVVINSTLFVLGHRNTLCCSTGPCSHLLLYLATLHLLLQFLTPQQFGSLWSNPAFLLSVISSVCITHTSWLRSASFKNVPNLQVLANLLSSVI